MTLCPHITLVALPVYLLYLLGSALSEAGSTTDMSLTTATSNIFMQKEVEDKGTPNSVFSKPQDDDFGDAKNENNSRKIAVFSPSNTTYCPATMKNWTEEVVTRNAVHALSTTNRNNSATSRRRSYPPGYLNRQQYDYYMSILDPVRLTLHVVTIPVLLLTIVAFSKDKKNNTSSKFIVIIAVFEMTGALFNLVFFCLKYNLPATCKVLVIWTIGSNYAIVCCRRLVYILNLLLATERLLAMTDPLKSRYRGVKRAQIPVFIGVPVFIFVYHIYLLMMYTIKNLGNDMYIMSSTEYYTNNEAVFENLGHFSKTGLSYIPLILTFGINMGLLRVLKQHNDSLKKARITNTDRTQTDHQTTLMIMVSTLSYTLLSLPPNINQMMGSIMESYNTNKQDTYLYSVVKTGANTTQTVGDLTNFLSYLILSSSFRQHLLATLFPRRNTAQTSKKSGLEVTKTTSASVSREKTNYVFSTGCE